MSDRTMETLTEIVGTLQRVGFLPVGGEIQAEVQVVDATDSVRLRNGWRRALVIVDWRTIETSGDVMLAETADILRESINRPLRPDGVTGE